MRKWVIRACVVAFWVVFILGALYFPKWNLFHREPHSINVFAWGDVLDPAVIANFEKETGIKVYLNYYSSNEELLVKLKATRGVGYDLVIPSDYAVGLLVQEELLKPLERKRLYFWPRINRRLLGHPYDPDNRYSIPFAWEIFGFGVDKTFFKQYSLVPSWKMLFDPQPRYHITMINDPMEAVQFAAFYLFGETQTLDAEQVQKVRKLLIRQKQWVEAYAEFRGDYFLATKNCPVVVASSSYIWRTMRHFDFVDFVVPREGTFITIENLSIPIASQKEDLVYRFINYLFRPATIAAHYQTYGFYPATTDQPLAYDNFDRLHFIHELVPQQQLRDIWVDVKSSREF